MLDEASPLGKEISFMMPLTVIDHQAPVPPPSYQHGQARVASALHIDALTLVTTLHLLALCHLAVRLAHRSCPLPLPAGPERQLSSSATKALTAALAAVKRLRIRATEESAATDQPIAGEPAQFQSRR